MIVGFSITRMEAEKDEMKGGDTNVNYRSSLTEVEEATVSSIEEDIARISFELGIEYQQDDEEVAEMQFEGRVLWQGDAGEVIENWDENEDIEEDVAATVTNHVYRKCLTRAVGMADALELPSPVPMPRVNR
ncbi:MAG: hypothetical protein MUP63_00425 [Candidatus Nanohaloarchaeota archaeon QJJ-7]|nr:hypothetical protein [Candidatus Nanohaloarchaeota archaeon QJJ-7]